MAGITFIVMHDHRRLDYYDWREAIKEAARDLGAHHEVEIVFRQRTMADQTIHGINVVVLTPPTTSWRGGDEAAEMIHRRLNRLEASLAVSILPIIAGYADSGAPDGTVTLGDVLG